MVDHATLHLLHRISIIVTPIKAIHHQWHVTTTILRLRVRLHILELHFNEPISILTFAVDPNRVWVDLRSRGLTLRHKLALDLNHITTCNLATIHLLLLGQCHDLAHWHLHLKLLRRN